MSAYNIEAILKHPKTRAKLKDYTDKVCQCPEIFAFLDAVEAHRLTKGEDQTMKSEAYIINKFMVNGSPMEINISVDIKNKKNIDAAHESVMNTLRNEIFFRYQTSEQFKSSISKMKSSMLNKITKGATNIDEEEAQLTKNWLRSGLWDGLTEGQNQSTFRSKHKIGVNVLGSSGPINLCPSYLYKSEGDLPYNIEQVLSMLSDPQYNNVYDNNLYSSTPLGHIPSSFVGKYPVNVNLVNYPMTWPMSNRDFVVATTAYKVSDVPLIYNIIHKSIEYKSQPRRGTVRATLFSSWLLQKTSETNTKYFEVTYRNLLSNNDVNSKIASCYEIMNKNKTNHLHSGLTSAMTLFVKTHKTPQQNALKDLVIQSENRAIAVQTKSNQSVCGEQQLEILKSIWQEEVSTTPTEDQISNQPLLKRITYVSLHATSMSSAEIKSIADISVRNNGFKGITGILLCAGKVFYQVMEGTPKDIEETFKRIKRDARHTKIRVVKEENNLVESERQFPVWSMRTVNLEDQKEHYFAQHLIQMIQLVGDRQLISCSASPSEQSALDALANQMNRDNSSGECSDDCSDWSDSLDEPSEH
ncbi:pacA [Acrasis kona]|uniref:PacA n=1 Tax=Acrasis kona TaxID=1008807 RepID=A0AAW2Z4E9_9EUKA